MKEVSDGYNGKKMIKDPNEVNIIIAILVFIGVIIILVSFVFGFFLSRRIGKPISELTEAAKELEKGNFKTRVDIHSGDELEELGKAFNKTIETKTLTYVADGMQKTFSVWERIGFLFYDSINGLLQERDVDYFHIAQTSKITFASPPPEGSTVMISYYAGRNSVFIDSYGKPLFLENEIFVYDGSTLTFTVQNKIDSVIHIDINGLVDEEGSGFAISGDKDITLLGTPTIGSKIGVCYIH
jgi:HAMP domain-containing protein